MDYFTRNLKVALDNEEYMFIKAVAEHDNKSFYEELSDMFRIGLEYCMSLPAYSSMKKDSENI